MSDETGFTEVPDNWDELDDDAKDAVTAEMLKRARDGADETPDETPDDDVVEEVADEAGERPARTFQEPGL